MQESIAMIELRFFARSPGEAQVFQVLVSEARISPRHGHGDGYADVVPTHIDPNMTNDDEVKNRKQYKSTLVTSE